MGIDDFVIGLLTIILGLALTELAAGMHRLLFHRALVRWDWLLPLAAFQVGWTIVAAWWVMWESFHGRTDPMYLIRFMLPLGQQLSLFVAARGILPRSVDGPAKLDLGAYYFQVKRYVWGAFIVTFALTLVAVTVNFAPLGFVGSAGNYALYGFALAFYVAMAVVDNRRFHCIALPVAVIINVGTTAFGTISP